MQDRLRASTTDFEQMSLFQEIFGTIYLLLNPAVTSYGMLNTTALALAETQIASVAERHMSELTPLIVRVSEIIPFVLAGELAGKGKIEDAAVAQQAVLRNSGFMRGLTAPIFAIRVPPVRGLTAYVSK